MNCDYEKSMAPLVRGEQRHFNRSLHDISALIVLKHWCELLHESCKTCDNKCPLFKASRSREFAIYDQQMAVAQYCNQCDDECDKCMIFRYFWL